MPVVDLPVSAEMIDQFDAVKHLLDGQELSRRADAAHRQVIVQMDMPDAPAQAAVMTPTFRHALGEGISLQSIWYTDADGHRVT